MFENLRQLQESASAARLCAGHGESQWSSGGRYSLELMAEDIQVENFFWEAPSS